MIILAMDRHTYIRKEIREVIKRRAKEKGLTLLQLSELIGVSYIHLKSVLAGYHTSRPLIQRIAQILELPQLPEMYEKAYRSKPGKNKKSHKSHKEVEP